MYFFTKIRWFIWFMVVTGYAIASENHLLLSLEKLKQAYPQNILAVCASYILWNDGTCMPLGVEDESRSIQERLNNPSLTDQLSQPWYLIGELCNTPNNDSGRVRYEPFFKKMYGESKQEVQQNLVPIAWMPNVFGDNAPTLMVTTVNNVAQIMIQISKELEELVLQNLEYKDFLVNPGGTFCWRNIAHTQRLSCHSFGMTIDINVVHSDYWQWDLEKENRPISEDEVLHYRNKIPFKIVEIFEKYGFIWGGKWYHYDTMHFEYRPELIE